MSDHDIAFWGMVANWFAALGTVGALLASLWLIRRDRMQSLRADTNALITDVTFTEESHVAPQGALKRHLVTIAATNQGTLPAFVLNVYVRLADDFLEYDDLFGGALPPGSHVEKALTMTDPAQVVVLRLMDGRHRVSARDAGNQYWSETHLWWWLKRGRRLRARSASRGGRGSR